MRSAIGEKVRNKELIVFDGLSMEEPKTKIMGDWLKKLQAGKSSLVVTKNMDKNIRLAARNIAGVGLSRVSDLNTYIVLAHKKLIVEKDAWKILEKKMFWQDKPAQGQKQGE